MGAGADPGLRAYLEPEISDAFGRHEPAISDAPGKTRFLRAKECGAYRRVNAVGPDQDVSGDPRPVVEPCLGALAGVAEADQAMAEMHALGWEGRADDVEQVGTMQGHMRGAVKLFAERIERRALQGAAVLPAPLMRAGRAHALAVESRPEPEPAQDAGRIRRHVNAAAYLGQLGRLLVDVDLEAGLAQCHGGGEAAYAAAYHRYSHPAPNRFRSAWAAAGARTLAPLIK